MPRSLDNPADLPPTLADTGAFSDLIHLTPNAGVVPYELNVPFWSDGAQKTRWFCLPDTNLTVGFDREASWSFPPGMVWIKHFGLRLTNEVPDSVRRIETRFLVRTANGVYGVTYRWDHSQTNATLVATEGWTKTLTIQRPWRNAHASLALSQSRRMSALSFANRRLGLGFQHAATQSRVQLRWSHEQPDCGAQSGCYFSSNVTGIHTLRALAAATNTAWSLEYRVRSYLAANCAQCHQPGTDCLAKWDARITIPTALAGIINGRLVYPVPSDQNGRVIVPVRSRTR
jgi:hypothetical protein